MRICYLAAADSIHSYRWARHFADQGHDVHWISLVPSTFDALDGIHLYVLPRRVPRKLAIRNIVAWALATRALVRRIAPDVFHAHYVGLNGLIAALAGYQPLIATAWGSDVLFSSRSRLGALSVRFVLRRATAVLCDADHMKRAMIGLGVAAGKITVMPWGTDTEKFRPGSKNTPLARQLGIDGLPVVISLRSLHPVYDVESLIDAVPSVVGECGDVAFVIVGQGPEELRLKALADTLGVSRHLRFVGRLAEDEIPAYLTTADVYVSTALSDAGLASSTAEAMSCGLPVIVTDSGENDHWVEDGVNGFVVPRRDPKALAEKIVRLLDDPELRRTCGQANRNVICDRNDFARQNAKLEALYTAVGEAARAGVRERERRG